MRKRPAELSPKARAAQMRAWDKLPQVRTSVRLNGKTYELESLAPSKSGAKKTANRMRLYTAKSGPKGMGYSSVRVVYAKPAKVWAVYAREAPRR